MNNSAMDRDIHDLPTLASPGDPSGSKEPFEAFLGAPGTLKMDVDARGFLGEAST